MLSPYKEAYKGAHTPTISSNHLFFCNHFEELQAVLFKAEMIMRSLIMHH